MFPIKVIISCTLIVTSLINGSNAASTGFGQRVRGEYCNLVDKCKKFEPGTSIPLKCSVMCGVCLLNSEPDSVQYPEKTPDQTSTRCTFTSFRSFSNWYENVITDFPILYPKSDSDLRNILEVAKNNSCTVRPSGTTHSSTGIIVGQADKTLRDNTVVVSLADYVGDDDAWEMKLDEANLRVRASGGTTQLKLYSLIRPKNLFLPTSTAAWLFSLGGMVANSVHGGTFGRSYVHTYVTAMRVMFANGEIKVIGEGDELRMWRNSYGLNGFILGVEMKLERRNHLKMSHDRTKFGNDLTKAAFVNHVEQMQKDNIHGQFFFDPRKNEILTVQVSNRDPADQPYASVQDSWCKYNHLRQRCDCTGCQTDEQRAAGCSYKWQFGDYNMDMSCRSTYRRIENDNDCTWDYTKSECRRSDMCSHQWRVGDGGGGIDQSCRITVGPDVATINKGYHDYIQDNPQIAYTGALDDTKNQNLLCLASKFGLDFVVRDQAMKGTTDKVDEAYSLTNDGFFLESMPIKTPYLGYFVPFDNLYDALQECGVGFDLNVPIEFRIVDIEDVATLQVGGATSGRFATLEVVQLRIPGHPRWETMEKKWTDQFYQCEQSFLKYGGFPHTGKLYGMGKAPGMKNYAEFVDIPKVFTDSQKQNFLTYRNGVDPHNIFWGGDAVNLLKI